MSDAKLLIDIEKCQRETGLTISSDGTDIRVSNGKLSGRPPRFGTVAEAIAWAYGFKAGRDFERAT